MFYCGSLIFTWLFCLCLNKFILKQCPSPQAKMNSMPDKDQFLNLFLQREVTQRARILLPFLSLFFWMTILFIVNNIKTNKVRREHQDVLLVFYILLKHFVSLQVIVDTTDLVKDAYDLLATKKILCWTKANTEVNLALSLPKSTTLSRLYHQKSTFREDQKSERDTLNSDKCLLGRDLNLLESSFFQNRKNYILVMSRQEGRDFCRCLDVCMINLNVFLLKRIHTWSFCRR